MCGMAGWVTFEREIDAHCGVLEAMTRTMALRGPDAEGIWRDRHVGLGHRRLAVIDIEGGSQPMIAHEDGRTVCLIYTGEIYNAAELRDRLKRAGHVFRTRSDTEVLLNGYLEWGEEVANHLNGMFAFAVWDTRREELLLIRDRLGVKPLFYYPMKDGVLFGSEPKAILTHPEVRPRVSSAGLCEVLLLTKNPGRTPYDGMLEVMPGQMVRVNRAGLTRHVYWRLEAREHPDDLETTIARISALLEDIMERQVVSDVPLCSLLSGGLDSSAITALAHRAVTRRAGRPLRSYSLDYVSRGREFQPTWFHDSPDAPFVRDFVAHTGCDHREVLLDSADLADPRASAAVLHASDFPLSVAGDTYVSLYRFFERVRAESTVALSGEAADELFGGYTWFHDRNAVQAQTFPWSSMSGGGLNVLDPGLLERLNPREFWADSYAGALAEVPRLANENDFERRMREIGYLHLTRLVPFLLDRKDRLSMAVGLEVRVPFCDHRLVEYVFNVPWRLKSFDGREKSLLRAATRALLPESIVTRRKCPYPWTQDEAYDHALRDHVASLMADRSNVAADILNRKVVAEILARPVASPPITPHAILDRFNLERVRSICCWMNDYGVELNL